MALTNNQIEILLSLRDKATRQFQTASQKMQTRFKSFTAAMRKNWLLIAAVIAVVIAAITKFTKVVIGAADKVQQYQTRMKVLLGTLREGNKVFADMGILAGKVPKTYDEIMASATDLAAVVKDGSKEITELMPIVVDLSAGTGMAVREVTGQVIRMYSAGAAAADMFRERGVSAALGFQAGVSVSAKETMRVLIDQWEDGTGKFVGAAKELAETFTGQMSMLDDAWFKLRSEIGLAFIESEEFKDLLKDITKAINGMGNAVKEWRKSGGMNETVLKAKETWFSLGAAILFVKGAYQSMIWGGAGMLTKTMQDFDRMIEKLRETQRAIIDLQMASASMGIEVEAVGTALEKMLRKTHEQIGLFFEEFQERFKTAISGIEGVAQVTADAMVKTFDGFSKSFGKAVADTLVYGKTFKGVMKTLAQEMAATFISSITEMIVKWTVFQALQGAFLAAQTVASVAAAATIAAAWAPAAAMVSLATLGGNAAPAAAGLASVNALSAGLAAAAKVPKLAEGGIVTSPTLAMIGERGPEAVVPLGRGGVGSNINIEINSPVFRNDEDITELAEQISLHIAMGSERL